MDQDNILDNLTTVNGKEEFEPQKPAKKKAVSKPVVKKAVQPKPAPKYSKEELEKLSSTSLTALCLKLNVATAKRKPQMIQNILNK
jgi:hypothetical protein